MRERLCAAVIATVVIATGAARADEAAPSRASVTFNEAIRRALAHNPDAKVALQQIQRSEALVVQARSGWLPTVTANGIYTRLDHDRVLSGRVISSANQVTGNIIVNVPLIAPKDWLATSQAKQAVEVARLSAVDTKKQVAIATGRAYLTVVAQHRVLETAKRALDTARAHETFAKSRFQGGVGNRLDAVRASQERASAAADVQNQLVALARAQEALGVLLGEDGPIDAGGDAALARAPSLPEALGDAATKRSDVLVQRERVEAARKISRDTWTEYAPMLSIVGQPFYQNPPTLTFPLTGWQAQLVLSLPLFDGGNRYGLHDEREAIHAQEKTKLEAALRQARADVRVAFEALRRADEALERAREAERLANEALELAQIAYRAGATSNLEVIDAERRAHDAGTAAAVAEDTARQARLDLLAASGRFPGP